MCPMVYISPVEMCIPIALMMLSSLTMCPMYVSVVV